MSYHVVKPGECLTSIARRYGFRGHEALYDHAANKVLRAARPDPNILHPGDRVFIPDRNERQEQCATGRVHEFTLHLPKRILRLAVEDLAGERLRDASYELTIEDVVYEGVTDGDGVVTREVPMHAEAGSLRVGEHVWPIRLGHLNPMESAPDQGVSGVQARLRNLGYDVGAIDNHLGPRTREAIRAFQRDNPPLVVDGICGPRTRARLVQKHGC